MEYLEKRGEYQQANSILKLLLTQKSFAASHRGHWFDRLALNLDYHLGDKNEVLVVLVISNFHSVGLLVLIIWTSCFCYAYMYVYVNVHPIQMSA